MEEKLSTIYLRDGRNALQYVMSLSEKYRQIATEAIFECLRLGYPLNNMEITGKARELQEEECLRLINIAKEQGLYIDKSDWGKFGDRRMIPTGESIVFLSEDGTTFTKMKSPFAKAPMKHILPEDIIYEHLIHNILFPSTRYRFIGFSEDIKGIRIVLQQRNISDMFQVPSQKTIDDYLINQLGLTKEDRYFYGNEYLAITDVSNVSDNVLCDEDGKLYFIDPIIRLKKSGREVWEYLYRTRCV